MKIIDMHCDTISKLYEDRENGIHSCLRENSGHLDLARMKKSNYLLQNFALFVDKEECSDSWEKLQKLYNIYISELDKNSDIIAPVLQFKDIAANEASGKMSAMLTVEEGAVSGGEAGRLEQMYKMGVRMITLTWNYPNELGYPNMNKNALRDSPGEKEAFEDFFYTPECGRGLTEKGREFVYLMEELGIIPDVSHLSDAGFYDMLECTRKPFAASHSNARSVCRCVRNLSDDMIKKLADRGGITGLNFCTDFLKEPIAGAHNTGYMEAAAAHARHITNIGGIEVLGLGSDFDGIDTNEELPGAGSMDRVWDIMKKSGYTERELDKIFYKNVIRVYKDTLK
ncbi:MAG: membrane dipeptidase [Lachnospiraceae bacterium]|nr:membrane dipeptidase [Lachnospiraceae bacterium]